MEAPSSVDWLSITPERVHRSASACSTRAGTRAKDQQAKRGIIMRAFAVMAVSLMIGCAPYTYDANGNPTPYRGSAALSSSENCGTPDQPKTCPVKRRITSSVKPQSYAPLSGAPSY